MPPSAVDPRLGAVLRRAREDKGLSQEQLAVQAGTSAGSVGRIERDAANPTWTTVLALIDTLGLSLPELADRVVREPTN